jgi:hypothetical protein
LCIHIVLDELIQLVDDTKEVQPKKWVNTLHKYNIMTILCVPYFGHNNPINDCVRFLLRKFHDDFVWLNNPYQVDTTLMHYIIGLPHKVEYLAVVLHTKDATKRPYPRNMALKEDNATQSLAW